MNESLLKVDQDQTGIVTNVALPQTTEQAAALAVWLIATPDQRLQLLVEMRRLSLLLSGQVAPWEMENFK